MEKILVTRVRALDAGLLEAFDRLMPQLTTAPVPTGQELQELLDSPTLLVCARLKDNGPIIGIGTLGVFRTPSGIHAHLEDVVVDGQARGLGTGEAIVQYLLQAAREMGLKGVSLTCNPRRVEANRLYQKMGFKKWETNTYWFEL